jgi:hypothetical protein
MRRSLYAPQRPSQPSQRDNLLFLFFAQDIAHVTERNSPPVQCPDSAISLAGFQVSTYGRFWVSPEGQLVSHVLQWNTNVSDFNTSSNSS